MRKSLNRIITETTRRVLRESVKNTVSDNMFQSILKAINEKEFEVDVNVNNKGRIWGKDILWVEFLSSEMDGYTYDYSCLEFDTQFTGAATGPGDDPNFEFDSVSVNPNVMIFAPGGVPFEFVLSPKQSKIIEDTISLKVGQVYGEEYDDDRKTYESVCRSRHGHNITENRINSIVESVIRRRLTEAVDGNIMPDDMFQDLLDNCYATVYPDRENFSVDDEVECVGELAGYTLLYTAEGKYDPGYEAPMAFCHDDPAFSNIGDDGSFTCRIIPDDTVVACDEDGNETKYALSQAQIKQLGKAMSKKCDCDGSNFEPTEYEREYDPSDW